MNSIFSKIVAGQIPCHKVAEDDDHLAFLDINPVAKGHTLVIPKKEIDYIFDLEDKEYLQLMVFAKKVAKAIDASFDCTRVGVSVIGLEVPHCHVHLMPISSIGDMNFSKEKLNYTQEELASHAQLIASKFI